MENNDTNSLLHQSSRDCLITNTDYHQTNSSARTVAVPRQSEQIGIQLFEKINLSGLPNPSCIDSWISISTEQAKGAKSALTITSKRNGSNSKSFSNLPAPRVSERGIVTAFESVEFLPNHNSQERRAKQKELIRPTVYHSFLPPAQRMDHSTNDDSTQRQTVLATDTTPYQLGFATLVAIPVVNAAWHSNVQEPRRMLEPAPSLGSGLNALNIHEGTLNPQRSVLYSDDGAGEPLQLSLFSSDMPAPIHESHGEKTDDTEKTSELQAVADGVHPEPVKASMSITSFQTQGTSKAITSTRYAPALNDTEDPGEYQRSFSVWVGCFVPEIIPLYLDYNIPFASAAQEFSHQTPFFLRSNTQPSRLINVAIPATVIVQQVPEYPSHPENLQPIVQVAAKVKTRTEQSLSRSTETIKDGDQSGVPDTERLLKAKTDYHPIGAASAYSEVPKIPFPVASNRSTQNVWTAGETVYYMVPQLLNPISGVLDEFGQCMPITRLFGNDSQTVGEHILGYVPIGYLTTDQTGKDVIVPQTSWVLEQQWPRGLQASHLNRMWNIPGLEWVFQVNAKPYQLEKSFVSTHSYPDEAESTGTLRGNREVESESCVDSQGFDSKNVSSKTMTRPLHAVKPETLDNRQSVDQVEPEENLSMCSQTTPELTPRDDRTVSSQSRRLYTLGLEQTYSSVDLQDWHSVEHVEPLPSFGRVHVKPIRVIDPVKRSETNVKTYHTSNHVSYRDQQAGFSRTEPVKIEHPPSTATTNRAQNATLSARMDQSRPASQTAAQFPVATKGLDHHDAWERGHHNPASVSTQIRTMHELTPEIEAYSNNLRAMFPPLYPAPIVTFSLPAEAGVRYEMEIGDAPRMKVGITTYSLKQEKVNDEMIQAAVKKSRSSTCLPLTKLRRKKVSSSMR